ncbi:MAG: hypothetical protein QGI83_02150 [Candidatus Latescibacteria bacterium]|nr:hypothetical protein [Candidatus Latescibacterota bacterium]
MAQDVRNRDVDRASAIEPIEDRGVTLRAVVFGLCLVVAVSVLGNTVRYILHASFMAYSHMPMGNLIVSLLCIIFCSILARVFGRRFVFSRSEWITIFAMGFISSLGPTYGVSGYLVGVIVTPYYFATPENRWIEFLHPYLPQWIIPANKDGAMTWFYDGLPAGAPVPWGAWAMPLFWWFTFISAVALVCLCASIIIHRQWSEHEKIVYPAMEPIVEIISNPGTGRTLLPEFMKGKVFWTGFVITFFVFGWNIVSWFYPTFPVFPTARGTWIPLGRAFPPQWIFLSTVVICFSYFASLEVLLSLWVFDLVFILEGGILNRLGIEAISPNYMTGRYSWQTGGAFVALALWWLFVSRGHIRDAFLKAWHPDRSPVDDTRELLSYRAAFIGFAASCLYTVGWLWQAGMDPVVIMVLMPTMLVAYFGVAKILADSGHVYVGSPTSAWNLTTAALGGAQNIPAATHAVLYPASVAINHFRGFAFSVGTHVNRLGDFVSGNKRRYFGGVYAAFVVGIVASTLFTVWLGYRIGGYNFQPNWLIIRAGYGGYNRAVTDIISPEKMEAAEYWFFLAGALFMTFLNIMRFRFTWWPFHPVGFALSGAWLTRLTSFTLFIAWLAKFILLKLVGASLYRKSRPFFIGVLVAYILVTATGLVVDAIWFGKQGHTIHKWY